MAASSTMQEDESCESTLLIRHLPSTLSHEEKTSLLKHFGASHVRVMGSQGRMKHCAFAVFPNHIAASKALKRLHQIELDNCRLSVEYSKKQLKKFAPNVSEEYGLLHKPTKTEPPPKVDKPVAISEKVATELNSMVSQFQMDYPINPSLKYRYPPPTMSILTNIANALVSVPKFYVQVLHLMNKMNLPAPFGLITATPPLAEDMAQHAPTEPDLLEEQAMDVSSSEESEIESDGDKPKPEVPAPKISRKRKAKSLNIGPNFKMQKIMEEMAQHKIPAPVQKPEEVFEQAQAVTKKNLALKIPQTVSVPAPSNENADEVQKSASDALIEMSNRFKDIVSKYEGREGVGGDEVIEDVLTAIESQSNVDEDEDAYKLKQTVLLLIGEHGETIPSSNAIIANIKEALAQHAKPGISQVEVGGFGKMEPVVKELTKEESEGEEEEEEEWGSGEFISSRRLRKGRISRSEMESLRVFKKYNAGDPATRLYIKNIHAKTTEKDLQYIYGRFNDLKNEAEKHLFNIQLMKEGRMKGQAFITFASEKQAKEALKDTNGFELNGKPLVVQFARSAKAQDPKEDEAKSKKN